MKKLIVALVLLLSMLFAASCHGGGSGGAKEEKEAGVPYGSEGYEESGSTAKEEDVAGGGHSAYAPDAGAGSEDPEDNARRKESADEGAVPGYLVFAGDVLLQGNITAAYDREGIGGILSEDLLSEFLGAAAAVVNEEFPFATGGEQAKDKQYTFKVNPSYVCILGDMGVDLVSLANNHVLDYGSDALMETFGTLDGAGIAYIGAGESLERASAWETFNVSGKSVAILSASRVIPVAEWDIKNSRPGVFTTYDSAILTEQIKKAKEENDLAVVYVHWGIEKDEEPQEYQRQLAREYIDAGADLVIGAHPHVLQGIEFYKGVPVVYSLGNFMFHETIDRTLLLRADVGGEGISLRLIAASAASSRTSALYGDAAEEIYRYVQDISRGVYIDEKGNVKEEG